MTRSTILLLLCASFSATNAEFVLHVSPKAADDADGSLEKPFDSIVAAQEHIRTLRKDGKIPATEAVTVELATGIYQVTDPVTFTAEDGGTAEAPVTYRSTKKGGAELRGGVILPSAEFQIVDDPKTLARLEESARGKVLVCELGEHISGDLPLFPKSFQGTPVGPWLYVDGEPMTLARWPNVDAENHGWATFSEVVDSGLAVPTSSDPAMQKARPGTFVFNDPRPATWDLEAGAWLLGYWTHDWSDENLRIDRYDAEKKTIKLAAHHNYGLMGGTWGAKERRFFAQNILSELDRPGEWFVDREEKKLFYYPARPVAESELVLATRSGSLVSLAGTKHLNLEGLSIGYSHGSGITAKNVEHLAIKGCTIRNHAEAGISLDGSHSTVQSCDIFNIGRSGISVSGGDRKTLLHAQNIVANNHIHHYARFQRTYAPGISVGGCGQTVRNNLIHDAPHSAILYSGNEHLLELNEIHHVVMETGDSGAFYTGRDWTSQGNIVRHNFIHDLGGVTNGGSGHTMGIYLDDCDSGDTLQGNVFYKAGRAIMIGGGRDNTVRNNLVIDCFIGLHLDARGMTWKQWNNPDSPSWMLEKKAQDLNYQNPPWSGTYPSLAKIMSDSPKEPLHNPIIGNVFINTSTRVIHLDSNSAAILPKLEVEGNLILQPAGANPKISSITGSPAGFATETMPADLGFTDAAKGDFSFRKESWLLEKAPGLKEIPFEKIGMHKDEWRTELP